MKVQMKSLLVSAAAVLALSACSKDDTRAMDRADAANATASAVAASAPAEPVRAPEPAAPVAPAPEGVDRPATATNATHTVVRGDTLSAIAKARGVSAADLASWNNIKDPRRLRVGQELRLTAP